MVVTCCCVSFYWHMKLETIKGVEFRFSPARSLSQLSQTGMQGACCLAIQQALCRQARYLDTKCSCLYGLGEVVMLQFVQDATFANSNRVALVADNRWYLGRVTQTSWFKAKQQYVITVLYPDNSISKVEVGRNARDPYLQPAMRNWDWVRTSGETHPTVDVANLLEFKARLKDRQLFL